MDQKQESNLILQRSVGGQENQFRQVVKDPLAEFRVIGIIRQGTISEQGRQIPIFYLYDLKGTLVASEKNREYLEEITTVKAQAKLQDATRPMTLRSQSVGCSKRGLVEIPCMLGT